MLHQSFYLSGALCAVLAAGLLAGCGKSQEPPAAAAPTQSASEEDARSKQAIPDKPRSAPTVTLTDADADRALAIKRGQVVEVRLPADRVGGFSWIPAENLLPVMSTDGVPEFEIADGAPAGTMGTEIWRFIGRGPGHAHLVFEYRQLTDLAGAAQRTVVYHFDVE